MTNKLFTACLLLGVLIFGAACGTVATPEFQPEPDAASEIEGEAATELEESTEVPPTEVLPTEVPPTEVPPTEVPPTEVSPTEVPPTDEPVAEAEGLSVAEAIAAGDIANGQAVFNASYQTSSGGWMCASCHSVDESMVRLVGPPMYGLYERGEERIAETGDASVAEYVLLSITMPAAYHVPAEPVYPENLMPMNYSEVLTDQELTDVVAYILSLGNE